MKNSNWKMLGLFLMMATCLVNAASGMVESKKQEALIEKKVKEEIDKKMGS